MLHCRWAEMTLHPPGSWLDRMDSALGRAMGIARWLVLPVALLLFLQWPLRDLVRAGSREVNDLGQWLFALFVAFAFTFAGRAGTHLAAGGFSDRFSPLWRQRLLRIGAAVFVLPWAGFMLYAAFPGMWQSLLQLERFPDTGNPGYWTIKLAAWLLAALAFVQALVDIVGRPPAKSA